MIAQIKMGMTTEEMGTIFELIIFLNSMPGIKVYLEDRGEFRVHYNDGSHTHLLTHLEDYQSLHDSIIRIIKDQHEYNLKNLDIITHEELKLSGVRVCDLRGDSRKPFILIDQESLKKYNERIKFLTSGVANV